MTKKYIILNLPIEPLDQRYSTQWQRWFSVAFARNGLAFKNSFGAGNASASEPPGGNFLHPIQTFKWKFSQLEHAVALIDNWRHGGYERFVVFLHDGWFPGIEAFAYMRDLAGFDIKIVAWWHAGAYDNTDLLHKKGCNRWAHGSEYTWLLLCDRVIVASKHHKDKLLFRTGLPDRDKVEVIGNPVEVKSEHFLPEREDLVVWPHRVSEDKCPEVFDRLSKDPRLDGKNTKRKSVRFVRTRDLNLSKEDYFKLLGRAKVAVSTATHENFGIAMVEAAAMGCVPLCPDSLAYPETMEKDYLYRDYDDLVEKVRVHLDRRDPYRYPEALAARFDQVAVTDKACRILREVAES